MPIEPEPFPWAWRAAFAAIQVAIAAVALLGWRRGGALDPRHGAGLRLVLWLCSLHGLAILVLVAGHAVAPASPGIWRMPVYLGVWTLVVASFLPQIALTRDEAARVQSFGKVLPLHPVGCLILAVAAVAL
ncbi:hypothetical protein [Falsiroseomonas ponticola]|uniref:hypothetical protein n=1 Tax=Falsiroseomonas ponticola TaxID=2786951 RepID=UPI00193195A3|nr:hypothetical protein [Roseomonas ponticola]